MDTGTKDTKLSWLNPDILSDFIDELREAGYRIGVSQYIAVQDLILALSAQGIPMDNPERLRTLLGPILCSSPTEQEDFQYRFDRWVELFRHNSRVAGKSDLKAKALSEELGRVRWRFQQLIVVLIAIILSGILLPVFVEWYKKDDPVPESPLSDPLPTDSPPLAPPPLPEPSPTTSPSPSSEFPELSEPLSTGSPSVASPLPDPSPTVSPLPSNPDLSEDWRTEIAFSLLAICIAFLVWRFWWLWRAQLFLQRRSTTQQPELHKISIDGFEQSLFPTTSFIQIAQNLRKRVSVSSNELDIYRTIDATLNKGGWFTPVYGFRQVLPEYLFLVDRTSYRDHQAKFAEEITNRLVQNGVFITIYYFDDDPRICFSSDGISPPQKLHEIAVRYPQHRLIIVSDAEKLFDASTSEVEVWVGQTTTWSHRAILTPKSVETWGYQELALAREFVVLPATSKGLQTLGQVFYQGTAIFTLSEGNPVPLPEPLRVRPYRWIERDPPPSEQIDAVLDALQQYLGRDGFYWFSACAIFPELHWNITIYLGNVLKTERGTSPLETCSVIDLARLPWFRYGYMPDWLRDRLIKTLTQEQAQAIRTALQDLLITAVQGSVGKLQLEVAQQHHSFLPSLANPVLRLLSRRAPEDSPIRDYTFLSFMLGQHNLAVEVPNEFSRLIKEPKTRRWVITSGTVLAVIFTLSLGIYYYPSLFSQQPSSPDTSSTPDTNLPVPSGQQGLLRTIRVTSGQWDVVRSVAISPDGQIIASGDDEGEVQLWNLSTGQLTQTLTGQADNTQTNNTQANDTQTDNIQAVAFSPDGRTIASGSVSERINIWNLDGALVSTIDASGGVYSLAFSPDGNTLVSGQRGGVIEVWDRNAKEIFSINDHSGNVTSIAMNPNGTSFASRSFDTEGVDEEIKLWNFETGQLIRTFNAGEAGGVNSIAISPDGRTLAGYYSIKGETVELWNLATGEVVGTLDVGITRPHAVAFSPDGQTLAVGGFADQIQIWDVSTQTRIRTLSSGIPSYQTYSLAFSPDGTTIFTSGSTGSEGVVMIWDTTDGTGGRWDDLDGSQSTSTSSIVPSPSEIGWAESVPQSGWCYQEDRLTPGNDHYLVSCHWSQQRCEETRGPNARFKQSPCMLVDLRNAMWNPSRQGWNDSWFEYRSTPFPEPFPQLPEG